MGRPKGTYRIPSYRLHKTSGQAVVTVRNRTIYLGKHNSPESHVRYGEAIASMGTMYSPTKRVMVLAPPPREVEIVRMPLIRPMPRQQPIPWQARLASDEAWERELIPLKRIPYLKWLPPMPNGKRIGMYTIRRWTRREGQRVYLETAKVRGVACVTQAALMRFFERLAMPNPQQAAQVPSERRRSIQRAEAVLQQAGIM